jgi:myosin heavy subunit
VIYKIDGFVEKNKDETSLDLDILIEKMGDRIKKIWKV